MNPEEPFKDVYKILVIGDEGVGKSSLVNKYSGNGFPEDYFPTAQVDFKNCHINLKGKSIKMQVWDIAVSDRSNSSVSHHYKGAHGIILMYDITNRNSFESIDFWLDQLEKAGIIGLPKLLVGNKADQEHSRQVHFEEAKVYAEKFGLQFLEASTKDLVNLDYVFSVIIGQIEEGLPFSYHASSDLLIEKEEKDKPEEIEKIPLNQ